ncbi:exocyst complex component 3-like protein 4 [Monodelphis domestica]|uniref:exocyst complex component 3-like protein 4 n=1 Tax=Monodelphis domestica TaxID=13616 RepID=UPI0024E1B5A5|nr:exocyst complex component 3-like protein 4 [Monodelphis domestica]XP_007473588.2 exocyst complex component 3-like protein 4 [Monodelphis domestica]
MGDQKQDQWSSPGKDSLTQGHGQEIDESSNLSPKKEKNGHLGLGSFKRAFSWKEKQDVTSGDKVGKEKRFIGRISSSLLGSFRKVQEEETGRLRQQLSSPREVCEESNTDSFSKTLPVRTKDPPQEKQSTPSNPCSPTQSQRSRKPSVDSTNSRKEEDTVLGLGNFKRTFLRLSKREGTAGAQAAEESSLLRKSSRLLRSFRKNEEEVTHRPSRLPKGSPVSPKSPKEDTLKNMMKVEEEKPVSDLIAERQLLKAFTQLCQLEVSLVEDHHLGKFKDDPTAYIRQAMDICVHFDVMASEIRNIVGETLSQPSVDTEALSCLAQLIKEEEGVHSGDASDSAFLRAPRKWRHLWEEAVKKSASDRVGKVGQGMSEPTLVSLLSELGRVIKQDLVKVRQEVQPCYPEDFLVWKTYVDAFHGAVSARLQELLQEIQGFEQLYVIMDWVANVYCSKDFLGSLDLELDMTTMPKLLAPEVWEKLESDYTKFLETKIKSCFDSILKLELNWWSERKSPELLQDLYHSPISIDIHMLVGEHVNTARAISSGLEATTLQILEQSLDEFIHRFEKRFLDSDVAKEQTLFLPYLCAYISAFQELKTNLPAKFLSSFKNVGTTLSGVISRFKKEMLIHLHRETQVLFKDVGSKAWVTIDKLQPIMEKTVTFAQYLKHMVQPHNQECLQEIHCYVVREYVAHVLRPRERLRGADRIASAQKMSQESDAIGSTFQSLGSEATWLGLAIPCISDILGETYKDDIIKHIETLIRGYPDIRQEHVAAILALRNLGRRRNQLLLRHAQDLLKKAPKTLPGQGLFGDIDVPSSMEVLFTCI